MNLSDTYVICGANGEITDYVFIDPSSRTHYQKVGRDGFDIAVSFSVASKIDKNYPVVFVDLTTSSGDRLEKIDYEEVPPLIKRRLGAWLKVQPQPAVGPSRTPAKSSHRSSSVTGSTATSSDRIKDELVRAHPGTYAADWKRRTRTKKDDGVHRRFEHADGRIVDTIERQDGMVEIASGSNGTTTPPAGKLMKWPDAEHSGVEIFISGPRVDDLACRFEEFGNNPDIVALFRCTDLTDEDDKYNGDLCDRLEFKHGVLWAAIDGASSKYVARIVDDCQICSDRNPGLSYMVVGSQPVGDDDVERYDVLFLKGFDAANNPMKSEHDRFYEDYVVRGI